ncbi:MAG: hypothetical protein E7534_02465 [Ruminococcaceae bacterium]|nr:hypothetical protein [Oscillospiraceae bacterium]
MKSRFFTLFITVLTMLLAFTCAFGVSAETAYPENLTDATETKIDFNLGRVIEAYEDLAQFQGVAMQQMTTELGEYLNCRSKLDVQGSCCVMFPVWQEGKALVDFKFTLLHYGPFTLEVYGDADDEPLELISRDVFATEGEYQWKHTEYRVADREAMASYDLLAIIIREPDANTDVSFLDFSYFSADLPADGGNDEGGTDDTVGGEDAGNNNDNTADNGNTNEDESGVQPENPDTGVVPSVAAMITAAVSAVFVVTKRR